MRVVEWWLVRLLRVRGSGNKKEEKDLGSAICIACNALGKSQQIFALLSAVKLFCFPPAPWSIERFGSEREREKRGDRGA